jgi:hypothetical protein
VGSSQLQLRLWSVFVFQGGIVERLERQNIPAGSRNLLQHPRPDGYATSQLTSFILVRVIQNSWLSAELQGKLFLILKIIEDEKI